MATVLGIDPRFTKQCSCRNCASVVAYAKTEVQTLKFKTFSNSTVKQDIVICPKCGSHINLFTKQ